MLQLIVRPNNNTCLFLGLQTVISVTHEAETLLDIFRSGQAAEQVKH